MRKLSGLSLIAALCMGIVSTNADAATSGGRGGGGGTPTTDGHSDACVTLCLTNGIQTDHPGCGPHRVLLDRLITVDPQGPGAGGGNCATTAASSAGYEDCGAELSGLRRVSVNQIRRINESEKVHLVPLCDVVHRSLTQQEFHYLARGNVQGLIPVISQNDTLMAELDDGGYRANDVIGVAVAQGVATLYVSRAH